MTARLSRCFVSCLAVTALVIPVFAGTEEYPTVPEGKTRGEKALKSGKMTYWADRADMAQVMTASFLGGKGTEWLTDGGFQPDGTVVLCGNVFGPDFEMPVKITVIGMDGPPVAAPVLAKDSKGREEKPSWKHDGTTGFIALLTPDLKKIVTVARLPWGSASITSAEIAKDGSLYIAGKATSNIGRLGGDVQTMNVSAEATRKGGLCDFTYIAKIAPDASKCLWVRTTKGLSDAPQLTFLQDGNIKYGAQDLRTLDPNGKLVGEPVIVPGGVQVSASVNPVDGTFVKGGEHNWGTGREPWRCPKLDTYTPDGKHQYQLYDWGGPYVVLDNCRQVSDTAVRLVTHDQDGNVLLSMWSDGGNSVATTQPNDIRRGVGYDGLGINSAGAGVLSCQYLVRCETKNYTCNGYTMWLAFRNGKPNGVSIDTLAFAADGSICFAGGSAWGLRQTSTKLANGEPAGEYVSVLTPDMGGCRFSSSVPGTGLAQVNNGAWGIASGKVAGKTRVMFMGSAAAEGNVYGLVTETPVRNPIQAKFGGGISDGYFIVLDLPKLAAPVASTGTKTPPRLSVDREARIKTKSPPTMPNDGVVYKFDPAFPRWNTVDAEIRDAKAAYWPNFMYGKPVGGTLTYRAEGPKVDKVVVECPGLCQPRGDQTRRVIGELVKPDTAPKLTLTLTSLEPVKGEDRKVTDSRGRESVRYLEYCEGKGVLDMAGRKVNIAPKCSVSYGKVVEKETRKVTISAYFTIKGRDIGLTGPLANEEIDFRVSCQGMAEGSAPPPKK